ncbi:hypothetical protein J3R83DRAFT_2433 [Lanmaoa asiatica]|nr:hypothetical protein J3R83DRAFT_2433 [Lanmaoa asiatica]
MPMVHNLTQMLADLWNKIKRDSSAHTSYISEGDIVVLYVQESLRFSSIPDNELSNSVVGPTGSGKSWFIKEATKSDLVKSSRGYHPFTGKVQAIQCELTDEATTKLEGGVKSIVLVDTPSFLTGCDHPDAEREISTWFDQTVYKPRYVGVIYMHRVETDPTLEPIQNHLREFSAVTRIVDVHLPQRVVIVISYDKTSGHVSESKITERRSRTPYPDGVPKEIQMAALDTPGTFPGRSRSSMESCGRAL